MKKKIFLLLISAVVSLNSFAQDNWDSVVYNGVNTNQNNFFDLEVFNSSGMLYAASGNGVNAQLYRSSTGDFGTWANLTGLMTPVPTTSINRISKLSYNAFVGKLFFGTGNNYGTDFINVYKTDGATSAAHGNIPFIDGPANDYQDISAIEYFSATGAPDSIFAFVSSLSGIEIWKTSASAASPTWIKTYRGSGISFLYDAVVFNNQLYVATCGDVNGGLILHSANGMTWDTLGYGGFGNSANMQIKSLAVYNNALYAGTENSSGAILYKTTDGVTWNQVGTPGLGFSTNLISIIDMKVIGGRLFVSGKYFNGSSNFVYTFYTNNGNTFYSTNAATPQSASTSNYPDDYRIEFFSGGVYSAGSSANYGEIWRLKMPVANFNFSNSTICANSNASFTNTSLNATAYDWSENNISVSTTVNYTGFYSTPGTVNLMLRAYNGNIYDSTTVLPLNIVPQVSGSLSMVPTNSVCPGQPTTITYTPISGTPPFSYAWVGSGGYPVQPNASSFTFNPANGGNYNLTVSDFYNCTYINSQSVGIQGPATDISGTVTYTGGPVTNGNVYLLKYQPTYSGTDTLAVLPIAANGTFSQTSALYGNYLLKADPDITIAALQNTISTYNGNTFRWDSAAPFLHDCFANSTVNIQVLELPAQNGTAIISGYLTEGQGYGQRLMNPQYNPFFVPGGPLKGIDVKLGKNPGGNIQARTTSDTSDAGGGRFEFTNVPPGNYRIYVDIPNLPMDSLREVTVLVGTDSIPDNNYMADSVQIYIDNPVGIKTNPAAFTTSIKVFPNPAKDHFIIEYTLQKTANVRLSMYDVVGKELTTTTALLEGKQTQLVNTEALPAGVYFVRLSIDGATQTMRVIVTR